MTHDEHHKEMGKALMDIAKAHNNMSRIVKALLVIQVIVITIIIWKVF